MDYFFNFEKIGYLQGNRPKGCVLCLLREGDPSAVDLTVYREAGFIVSLNLYPYNPGHLIVFPERHVEDIRSFDDPESRTLDKILRLCLDTLDEAYAPQGYNIGCNMGLVAGASIAHLHWHVIPRYPREIGIAELIGGKRVLVEDPEATRTRLSRLFAEHAV